MGRLILTGLVRLNCINPGLATHGIQTDFSICRTLTFLGGPQIKVNTLELLGTLVIVGQLWWVSMTTLTSPLLLVLVTWLTQQHGHAPHVTRRETLFMLHYLCKMFVWVGVSTTSGTMLRSGWFCEGLRSLVPVSIGLISYWVRWPDFQMVLPGHFNFRP